MTTRTGIVALLLTGSMLAQISNYRPSELHVARKNSRIGSAELRGPSTSYSSRPDASRRDSTSDLNFAAAVAYGAGGYSSSAVAIADLNGDGKLDVLVSNLCVDSNSCVSPTPVYAPVGVLLGNGDGTLQGAVSYASGGYHAISLAVGDVNADAKPDLLVLNECDDVSSCVHGLLGVLLGNGDGTFQSAVSYDTGGIGGASGDRAIALIDANDDGHPDVIVVNYCGDTFSFGVCSTGTVGVLLGVGDGTFQPALTYDAGGYGTTSLAVGDINGDGTPDLVLSNLCAVGPQCSAGSLPGSIGVMLGNGDGRFQRVVTYDPGADESTNAVALADVNADGKPDIVALAFNGVGVLLGNGDGTFQRATIYDTGGFSAVSLAVADLNADGKLDLAVANRYPAGMLVANVSVLLGNGDGSFNSAVSFSPGGDVPLSVAVADLDSNATPDLLVANQCLSVTDCTNGVVGVLINTPLLPDFSISSATARPDPIHPGQSASAEVAITGLNGFSGAVSLTCSVQPLPAQAPQCSLNPTTAIPGNSVTLTITTTTLMTRMESPFGSPDPFYVSFLPVVGFAAAGIGSRFSKRVAITVGSCLVVCAALLLQNGVWR